MDIGFELKEVQVTPGSFDGIMHVALWFAACHAARSAPSAFSNASAKISLTSFSRSVLINECLHPVMRFFQPTCAKVGQCVSPAQAWVQLPGRQAGETPALR